MIKAQASFLQGSIMSANLANVDSKLVESRAAFLTTLPCVVVGATALLTCVACRTLY